MRALILIALVLILIPLIPIILTLKPLIVLSSSMTPLLGVGDLVIVKPIEPSNLKVGDILAFKDPAGRKNVIITHRIVEIEDEKFQTKGDAVEEPDQFVVHAKDVVGIVIFDIPYLGYFFDWAKKKEAFFILILIPSAIIIASEIRRIRIYANPLLEARLRKREAKRIRLNRVVTNYERAFSIFLSAFLLFAALSLPCMFESGYDDGNGNAKIESSVIPKSVVYKLKDDPIPKYRVLFQDSIEISNAEFVSVMPCVCVFWHSMLAFNPYFPAIAFMLLAPLLVTLLLLPIWRRSIYRKRKRRLAW
jgi:signal peptidase